MIYEFQATQDLHGYDKPWALGEGPNLFDPETAVANERFFTTGIITASGTTRSDYIPVTAGESYYALNVHASSTMAAVFWFSAEKEYIGNNLIGGTSPASGVVEAPEGAAYAGLNIPSTVVESSGFNTPSTLTQFYPYANICPPEGFNIWDPYNDEFIQVYAGYVNTNTRELYLRPVYEEYAGEELVGPWMSSLDPYAEDTTPTTGAFVIDFGGELTSFEITPFMLQTLLDSLGIRQHFTDGAGLLNSLMDQAQGRVRSEEELLHLSRPLKVIPIGDQLPAGLTFRPISKDVLPGLPGKFIR